MKGRVWQRPQPFLHQALMVTGCFDSSTWEMVSAGYIWTNGACRDADGWMDRTERIEDKGTRGEIQGLFGKGKLKYDWGGSCNTKLQRALKMLQMLTSAILCWPVSHSSTKRQKSFNEGRTLQGRSECMLKRSYHECNGFCVKPITDTLGPANYVRVDWSCCSLQRQCPLWPPDGTWPPLIWRRTSGGGVHADCRI